MYKVFTNDLLSSRYLGSTLPLIILLSGCAQVAIDPYPSFQEVQERIACQTGHPIYWESRCEDPSFVRQTVEETLSKELNIGHVVQLTLLNNPKLQALYEKLGVAQAELVQAGLLSNPIFNLSYMLNTGSGSGKLIDMGLIQNLLDLCLIPLKTRLATAELERSKTEIIGELIEIIAQSRISYYTLQAATLSHEWIKKKEEVAEAAYEMALRLRKSGNVKELFLISHLNQFEQAKMETLSSELAMETARENLQVLMGLPYFPRDWTISLAMEDIPGDFPLCISEIESHVIENSTDLKGLNFEMERVFAARGIKKSEKLFPEFGMGLNSEKEPEGNWFVGPQILLGIPIFDFGIAQSAALRSEIQSLCHLYHSKQIELLSLARRAHFQLQSSYKQYNIYKNSRLPLAEKMVEEMIMQLNAMQVGVFDALLAKKHEFEVRQEGVMTYRDYYVSHALLEMLMQGRMPHNIL